MSERLTVRTQNGYGEEYSVEFEVLKRINDRQGVQVVVGRNSELGSTWALVIAEGRQLFATGPASDHARQRALDFAEGYRAGALAAAPLNYERTP